MRFKGWKKVFAFTFMQQIKSKSFIISTIIIMTLLGLIGASANIIPVFFLDDVLKGVASGEDSISSSVSELSIYNNTDMTFDFNGITPEPKLVSKEEADKLALTLENTSTNGLLITVNYNEGIYSVDGIYAGVNSTISKGDCEMLCGTVASSVRIQYLKSLGVKDEDLMSAMSGVSYSANMAGKEATSPIVDIINSIVPMLSSLVLFMFIFSYSTMVSQSVATEKTSRVIEYLLTSVKPLAIIMGKILAMCTVSLLQFIVIMIGGAAGVLISLPFGILSKVGQLTAMAATSEQAAEAGAVVSEFSSAFSSFNFGSIIFMLIVFVLGFLFFATVAGLAGASISKMEDLSAASQPLSLLGVVGFYLAYFPTIGAVTGETNMMMIISRYLPISSPFALPSAVLLNQMSVVEAIISVLILLASVIVMLMVVAKVYEAIILHNGNRLKLSDMFAMAKSK